MDWGEEYISSKPKKIWTYQMGYNVHNKKVIGKRKAELKLEELHIVGIKSIKPFKGNKFIIKAENGTFALPKDKLDEAEKINFTKELIIWQ